MSAPRQGPVAIVSWSKGKLYRASGRCSATLGCLTFSHRAPDTELTSSGRRCVVKKHAALHLVRKPSHIQTPPSVHPDRFLQPFIPLKPFDFLLSMWFLQGRAPDNGRPRAVQRRAHDICFCSHCPSLPFNLRPFQSPAIGFARRLLRSFMGTRFNVLSVLLSFLPPTGRPPQLANLSPAASAGDKV